MFTYKYSGELSESKIEEKARGYGMHKEGECKVFFKGVESTND